MIEPLIQLTAKRFQVALSFAGEHRNFVEGVAEQLSRILGQNRVFYDRYYEAELARRNLDTYLTKIYQDDTDLLAIFLCSNYKQKKWCGLEWRAVRDVLQNRPDAEVMPFKFDDVIIEGLLPIDGYIAINNRKPEDVACLILQRIDGKNALPIYSLESKSSVACDEIELVLDVDFEAFTPEREHRLVRALSLLLQDSDVRIRRKSPGNSTILTLDLTSQQWNILKNAIERGELAEFKPKELLVNGVSVIKVAQDSIGESATPAARPTVADNFEADGSLLLQAVESIIIATEPTRGAPASQYRITGKDRRMFQQALQYIADFIRDSGGNPDIRVLEEILKAYDRGDLGRVTEHLYRLLYTATKPLTISVQAIWQPGIQRLLEFRAKLSNSQTGG